MSGGAIANTSTSYMRQGAVTVANGAKGTISGGTIEDTKVGGEKSGSLLVDGANLVLSGGSITGGKATNSGNSTGGVLVLALAIEPGGSEKAVTSNFTMNGGTISDCESSTGAGVYVMGGTPPGHIVTSGQRPTSP